MERRDVIAHSTSSMGDKPQWLKDRLEWFQDQKFGIILHWGPYCQWDCCESWPISPGDPWARNDGMKCWTDRGKDIARFQRDYWKLNETFNPVGFDADAWMEAIAASGARYLAFTTKHHDGFCMWDTATTDYRITHPSCPYSASPRRDIFGEVARAAHKAGIGVTAYFSKADWHSEHYWSPDKAVTNRGANTLDDPAVWAKFVTYTHEQIRELMSRYGKIDALWLDAGWVRDEEDIDMAGMVAMARELQPGLIVANRTVGDAYEDFVTPEHQIPDAPLDTPWESCLCLGNGWKYSPPEYVCRPTREAIDMLVDIVSRGGNFLMGFGPDTEGRFPDSVLVALAEIGDWMRVNGEAIYRTRAIAPYSEADVRFTSKSDTVFAFLPSSDSAVLRSLHPAPGSSVRVLGCSSPATVTAVEDGVRIDLPQEAASLTAPVAVAWAR